MSDELGSERNESLEATQGVSLGFLLQAAEAAPLTWIAKSGLEGTAAIDQLIDRFTQSDLIGRVADQPSPSDEMVFTPGAKRVTEDAYEQARAHQHPFISTEYLLLACLDHLPELAAFPELVRLKTAIECYLGHQLLSERDRVLLKRHEQLLEVLADRSAELKSNYLGVMADTIGEIEAEAARRWRNPTVPAGS